mmetsp:Transcript_38497/g.85934  ORF Transcript_38497/g.85934 Transcript_38497/m.85934 type:complete len:220 (+) Transcript_38497:101-760(+)
MRCLTSFGPALRSDSPALRFFPKPLAPRWYLRSCLADSARSASVDRPRSPGTDCDRDMLRDLDISRLLDRARFPSPSSIASLASSSRPRVRFRPRCAIPAVSTPTLSKCATTPATGTPAPCLAVRGMWAPWALRATWLAFRVSLFFSRMAPSSAWSVSSRSDSSLSSAAARACSASSCSCSTSSASSLASMSGSMKSPTFLPSIISGTISYLHSSSSSR